MVHNPNEVSMDTRSANRLPEMDERRPAGFPLAEATESSGRSEAVDDMLSRAPSWLLRWGVLSVVAVIGLILAVSVFVRYPDTLEGTAIITTDPLPIRLKAGSTGRMARLFITDGLPVLQGAPIAEIENPTGYEQIVRILAIADSAQHYLDQGNTGGLAGLCRQAGHSFGEAQPFYNQLLQYVSAYLVLKNEQIHQHRISNLRQQMDRYRSSATIISEEKQLTEEALAQSRERFEANERLYRDKVISRQEYFEEAERLRAKQHVAEGHQQAIIQNQILIGAHQKQILEISFDNVDKENNLKHAIADAIRNLKNYVRSWELQYLLVAPYDGFLHYLKQLQQNEPVAAGDELFAVIPDRYHYIAQAEMASAGLGKVKSGQPAHLLLDQFPYNEFGFLEGRVAAISVLPHKAAAGPPERGAPTQAAYRIIIELPDSLTTSHGFRVPFNPEMAAKARIITRERNLLQRLAAGVLTGKR